MAQDFVFINGGQRGLQVRLNPRDAATLLKAVVAPLRRESSDMKRDGEASSGESCAAAQLSLPDPSRKFP